MNNNSNEWADEIMVNNLPRFSNEQNRNQVSPNSINENTQNTQAASQEGACSVNNVEGVVGNDPRPDLPWDTSIDDFDPVHGSIISGKITSTFHCRQDVEGSSWKGVTKATKDFYFDEFKKEYKWDSRLDRLVRKAWEKKAPKRYSDMLTKARSRSKTTPNYKPDFISPEAWKEWNIVWELPENKAISARNSANRRRG